MKHLLRSSIACFSLLGALLCGSQEAQAQFKAANVNGVINNAATEYGGNNNVKNSSDAVVWSMTWNNNNLYIGIQNTKTRNFGVVYIDRNPIAPVNGGGNNDGNTAAVTIANSKGTLPFRADFAISFRTLGDRTTIVQYYVADGYGGWNQADNSSDVTYISSYSLGTSAKVTSNTDESGVHEIAIPWNVINNNNGRPAMFNFLGYVVDPNTSNNIVLGPIPAQNTAGGVASVTSFPYYFTVSSTATGQVNIDPISADPTGPFSRTSYTKGTTGDIATTPPSTPLNVYDLTLNAYNTDNRISVTRGSNNPTFNITHDFLIGSQVSFSASNAKPINVGGALTIRPGGLFFQEGAPITVGGDFIATSTVNASGGFTAGTSSSSTLTFNGGQSQSINVANLTVSRLDFTGSGVKQLVNNLTVNSSITLSGGARLRTGENTLTLGSNANLIENVEPGLGDLGGYIIGNVVATSTLSGPSSNNFNGIGLTLNPRGPIYPGGVTVKRITGENVQGPSSNTTLPATSIFRRYIVTVNNGNNPTTLYNTDLRFDYRDSQPDELGGIAESNLRLFRSDVDNMLPYERLGGTVNQSNNFLSVSGLIRLNSTFTLGDGARPLPIELVSFTGDYKNNGVLLNWATASEKDNKGFGVERRVGEGNDWQQLAFVAGKSATGAAYSYVDATAPQGTSYYRLRQEDNDGTTAYSPVVAVLVAGPAGGATLALSPVPTTDVLTISGFGNGKHVAEVYDLRGRRVLTQEISNAQATLSVSTLPSGVYLIRVQGAGTAQKGKFVKL